MLLLNSSKKLFILLKKKVKYGRTSFLNLIRSEGGGTSSFNDWWKALLY